jgi:hypothetical protein
MDFTCIEQAEPANKGLEGSGDLRALSRMTYQFTAEIHLPATETGGRKGPLLSGEWRTVLGVNNGHWSARITFAGQPSPGQSFTAGVELLRPDVALEFFTLGAEFTVWEGGTKGTGRVVSVTAQPKVQADGPASGGTAA